MTHHFEALGWTLIHFCWQAAVIAIVYRAADSALRKSTSQVRYVLALAALMSMLCASLVTLAYEERRVSAAAAMQNGIDSWPADAASAVKSQIASLDYATAAPLTVGASTTTRSWLGEGIGSGLTLGRMMPWVDMVWLAGVLCLSLRTLGGWFLVERLRNSRLGEAPRALQAMFDQVRHKLELSGSVLLCVSEQVTGPLTIGVFRAVVILPASAMLALDPDELEVVLAHELAHVRRADYLWNLIQTLVETLFFFHPAVWWVSRSLREQRELCCDDVALRVCGNPSVYASALYRLEEQRTRNLHLAMALDGNQSRLTLRARIERILGEPSNSPQRKPLAPLSLVGVVAALAVFLMPMPQMLASLHQETQQTAPSPSPSPTPSASEAAPQPSPQPQAATEQKAAADAKRAEESQAEIKQNAKSIAEVQARIACDARKLAEQSKLSEADRKQIEEAKATLEQQLKVMAESKAEMCRHAREIAEAQRLSSADMQRLINDRVVLTTNVDKMVKVQTKLATKDLKDLTKLKTISAVDIKGLVDAEGKLAVNLQSLGNMKFAYAFDMKDLDEAQAAASADAKKATAETLKASPDYIDRMKAAGYDGDIEHYSGMKMMGVTPEFAEEMSKLGLGKPSANDLIGLKMQGVTIEYVKQMREAGIVPKSFRELITYKMFNVTPQYLADMKSAGFGTLPAGKLVQLKIQGVTPEFAKAAKAQFPDATVHDVVALQMFHIDAAFIESARQRGVSPLTVQKLVQLKMFGKLDSEDTK